MVGLPVRFKRERLRCRLLKHIKLLKTFKYGICISQSIETDQVEGRMRRAGATHIPN